MTMPPKSAASFPAIEQLTNRVAPVGLYTPFLPSDLLPEIAQFTKIEPVDPVLKYANPPLEDELELASLPKMRTFEKVHDTLP